MQSLGVISLNIWQIVISLCNLVILYLILRKFLYAPVCKVLAARTASVDRQYADADKAKEEAQADRAAWESKLAGAQDEADALLAEAGVQAERRGEQVIADARQKAEGIVRTAQSEAEAERRRAEAEMHGQIADLSALLAEKLIERELGEDDHRRLIDSFLAEIGESGDAQ